MGAGSAGTEGQPFLKAEADTNSKNKLLVSSA